MLMLEIKETSYFFSVSFFDCLCCCFFFFYPMSSAKVSLDCITLGCQINQWKASAAAIRNTNDEGNFQM